MRWLRGFVALLAILIVVAGAPALLIGWGRLADPAWWRADDGSLLLAILTVAGWLAWLMFTLATAAEVARYASGNRFVVNLPLLGALQAMCAGLVLAVVALAATTSPGESRAGTPSVPPVAHPAAPAPVAPAAPAVPVAPQASPSVPPASGPHYAVASGDDLWSIAERVLGDGRRWRELKQANPELLADPTRRLSAGTRLALPDDTEPERITVVRGDTLSELAEEHLGRAGLWPRIAAANAELIEDPDHIEVGWVLELPAERATTTASTRPGADGPTGTASDDRPAEPTTAIPSETPATPLRPDEGTAPAQDSATTPPAPPAPPISPAETSRAEPAEAEDSAAPVEASNDPDLALVGGLSAMAAAGLMGGWQARRLLQSRVRPPGRRVAQPSDDLARFHSAIGRRQAPDHPQVLDAALRVIGRHHHRLGIPLPPLAQVTVTVDRLLFQWAEPAGDPPRGFGGDSTAWLLDLDSGDPSIFTAGEHPCAFPALVSLGTAPGGETVMVDVERSGVLGVAADSRELQLASLASLGVELACAPWAAEVSLVLVGPDGGLARTAGGESVTWLADPDTALTRLRQRHGERARALAGLDLSRLRTDPERAEAVAPEVYVFHDPLPPERQDELDRLLQGSSLGLAAVVSAPEGEPASWAVFGDPLQPSGRLAGEPTLTAHAIPEATRSAVESLYRVAETPPTDAAPWWSAADTNLLPLPARGHHSEDDVEIVTLRPRERPHPTLLLLGPVDLTGAGGPEPARARSPLMEMATWLLEHPGRTATEMASGLGIAESTRRSNMSRLRSWLGTDEEGEQYLPDAYSGRIRLHPDVTSDVVLLRLLTGPGVNRIGDAGLVSALELVRGAMLADAAPGQWFWAEGLRSDVTALLRDAGLVLVDRALAQRDLDLARWAAERALLVCPEDELLVCARIRTENAAGNRPAVERYVLRLAHQARSLGVDLLPETIMLCQQVMEGRPRMRRA